jgi:tetratricopeptide (TPR) repeat protein
MNSKPFILFLLVLCFAVSFSGLCTGEDQKTSLTVKKIAFTRDKHGRERIELFCNQSCVPELFSLEDEKLRVVMDMKGVSLIQTKVRNVKTKGKLVKRVRSYLDKQTKILRVVLDMAPSKYYIVRSMPGQSGNAYVLTIYEVSSLSTRKPGGNKDVKVSPLSEEKRITILRPDLGPGKQGDELQEAIPSPKKHRDVSVAKAVPSVDQGRSQLNAGEFATAVDTFTQILTVHPQDSLGYRLRGNAYDNLGDRQKAVQDWTQAARLGDTTIQSYLDFLQVKWRKNPAP